MMLHKNNFALRFHKNFGDYGGPIRFFKKLCDAQLTTDPDDKANAKSSASLFY